MTIDDEFASYSTTFDETTRSVDNSIKSTIHHSPSISSAVCGGDGNGGGATSAKQRRNRVNKRNRDIKLALLMIFSGAFLIFVLPETLLNIYKFHRRLNYDEFSYSFVVNSSSSANVADDFCRLYTFNMRLNLFLDVFHMLKLLYFSSNFLAYLTLTTFGHVPRRIEKQLK